MLSRFTAARTRSTSPWRMVARVDTTAIGAEIAIKTMLKGFRVGEVGIQTFPREFGRGSSTSLANILATLRDMRLVYREVFSPGYDRPLNH